MQELLTLEFDGGSRGNPGQAGIGVVIRAADGTPLVTLGRFIGRATNNAAEYHALITALQQASQLGARRIHIRGDSELVVRQIKGQYRVRHPDLRPLHEEAVGLLSQFSDWSIEHNVRDKNTLADRLANLAMDRRAEVTDAAEAPIDEPSPTAPNPGDRFTCPRCGCAITLNNPSPLRPHQLRPFTCQCGMKMQPV